MPMYKDKRFLLLCNFLRHTIFTKKFDKNISLVDYQTECYVKFTKRRETSGFNFCKFNVAQLVNVFIKYIHFYNLKDTGSNLA